VNCGIRSIRRECTRIYSFFSFGQSKAKLGHVAKRIANPRAGWVHKPFQITCPYALRKSRQFYSRLISTLSGNLRDRKSLDK
jgi:hypothetical protein